MKYVDYVCIYKYIKNLYNKVSFANQITYNILNHVYFKINEKLN